MPDTTLSTLDQIRTKVRRLTRSPSNAQLSTADIDTYVNNFVLYDFPETLRTFDLRTKYEFFTTPYIDTYATNALDPNTPLGNFKNQVISVHPPVYCDGYQVLFSQSREQFFNAYPMLPFTETITTGTGANPAINGTLGNVPVIPGSITFSSVNAGGEALVLIDYPDLDPVAGVPQITGTLDMPFQDGLPALGMGTINYKTGVYVINLMPDSPALGAPVYASYVPNVPSRPMSMLYFEDKFTLRPVPDRTYKIEMEVYLRPTELLNAPDMPEMAQWWQYIAYGASKKVFEDRLDMDSIQLIMPELKNQERLINRKTIVQQTNERTSTIFTEQGNGTTGGGWGGGLF
jgi:hypothetical protein